MVEIPDSWPSCFSGLPEWEPRGVRAGLYPGELVMMAAWWYEHPELGRFPVMKGFVTDLASTPQFLRIFPFFDPLRSGTYWGALPHDALYCAQLIPRHVCDRILRDALMAAGVSNGIAWAYWAGVRLGGWWPWLKRKMKGGGVSLDDFVDQDSYAAYLAAVSR